MAVTADMGVPGGTVKAATAITFPPPLCPFAAGAGNVLSLTLCSSFLACFLNLGEDTAARLTTGEPRAVKWPKLLLFFFSDMTEDT